MSEETSRLIDITDDIEYVYIFIPKEYVCVYHRILAMLADYGVDMLKDCKASCSSRNSNIIECFNMFNAAVAAYKLNKTSLANTLINYVKAKITQMYSGRDNSTTFMFPVDRRGEIKAFVSCEDDVTFRIDPADGNLFGRIFRGDGGVQENFFLGPEDGTADDDAPERLMFNFDVSYSLAAHLVDNVEDENNLEITITISNIEDVRGNAIDIDECNVSWSLAGRYYIDLEDVVVPKRQGLRLLNVVVYHNGVGVIHTVPISLEI